ncbi:MAG: translation initiation factor IF-2 [Firmicutes bacterium]|nr:translation initiation factor IF-2 [Bacillota bacterium]
MLKKYRIYELSKDLDISSKDIIKSLSNYFDDPYNHMTSLKEIELDVIFEYYTKKFEVQNFDDYFSKRNTNLNLDKKKLESIIDSYKKKPAKKQNVPSEISKKERERILLSGTLLADKNETLVEKKVINTRTEVINNTDKYDERYERIAYEKNSKKIDYSLAKQKIHKHQNNRKFKKRESESERLNRIEKERKSRQIKILIPENITVAELASKLKATAAEVIKKLSILGVNVSINDTLDFDTASLVSYEFSARVEKEVNLTIEEMVIDESKDMEEDLVKRPPVVVVMGHVDHGKTSLIDYIRKTKVALGEHSGITQHIGAYKAFVNGRSLTFLDTPGHEAFTSMRARGAKTTDVAILVVASDDGIMPQTIEAINHAKEAGLSIVVAINKIDKPESNPDRIKQQLMEHNIVPEEWGGDVICVPVSAKDGTGINDLLDMVILTTDLKNLKANPNRSAKGVVIEARIEKGRGVVATVLVTNGTLNIGDTVVAGVSFGKVRSMVDEVGKRINALPSDPVEITGLDVPPVCGDTFDVISDEKLARQLVNYRKFAKENKRFDTNEKVSLENLLNKMQEKDLKELKLIIKADVNGSSEALKQSLEKLSNSEVIVKVIHSGIGAINESDVMLAKVSNALLIGFNVRPSSEALESSKLEDVEIKLYRVIYECIDEIKESLIGMLEPKTREVKTGSADCRKIYTVSGIGTIAGCYVTDGKIIRGSLIRVVRDGIVKCDDKIKSLKRFKDDAKEVVQGYECGIGLERFNDLKIGDVIESYCIEEYK